MHGPGDTRNEKLFFIRRMNVLLQARQPTIHALKHLATRRWPALAIPEHIGRLANVEQDHTLFIVPELITFGDPERSHARIAPDQDPGDIALFSESFFVAAHGWITQ